MRSRKAATRDLVGFHFGCSDFARSLSMTDVEGGKQAFAASAPMSVLANRSTNGGFWEAVLR